MTSATPWLRLARNGRLFAVRCLVAPCWVATLLACSSPALPDKAPPAPHLSTPERVCQTRGNPGHRARYCMAQARAHMTGYRFSPARGPRALAWLSEAAACFDEAADPGQGARAAHQLTTWRARLDADLRVEQLRLEHALALNRRADLARATRFLLALLSNQPRSAYRRWLEQLARSLP